MIGFGVTGGHNATAFMVCGHDQGGLIGKDGVGVDGVENTSKLGIHIAHRIAPVGAAGP